MSRENQVLNRLIRWTDAGIEYEADARHARLLVEEAGMESAKPVGTPGTVEKILEAETELDDMSIESARRFRSSAARANYLSVDCPDIQFAVKEIANA
eukprot:1184039-Karenia_brevis.AAC.1